MKAYIAHSCFDLVVVQPNADIGVCYEQKENHDSQDRCNIHAANWRSQFCVHLLTNNLNVLNAVDVWA